MWGTYLNEKDICCECEEGTRFPRKGWWGGFCNAKVTPKLGSRGGLSDGWGRSFANHGPLLQEALGDGEVLSQDTLFHTHPFFCFLNFNLVSLILEGEFWVLGKFSFVSNIHFHRVLYCHSSEQDVSCYVGW